MLCHRRIADRRIIGHAGAPGQRHRHIQAITIDCELVIAHALQLRIDMQISLLAIAYGALDLGLQTVKIMRKILSQSVGNRIGKSGVVGHRDQQIVARAAAAPDTLRSLKWMTWLPGALCGFPANQIRPLIAGSSP